MGREVTVKVVLDSKQAQQDVQEFSRKAKAALQQPRDELGRFKKDADAATVGIKSMHSAAGELRTSLTALRGAFAALGIASAIGAVKQFANATIQAAINIDRQVNSLKALTGSAEAATRRFAELFAIAQRSPGLTTSLAATLDAQLRIFDVNVKTIDRLLPVIGKLNAISPLGDPRQFVNNLTQLITQNFERQDLKELVGASPIAGKLIKEIFNVDNPTNAEAIRASAKRLGITTVERLAEELIKAGETNSALKNATESLAGQFEKLQDRINVALAPIGDELLKTIMPAFREFVELLERDLPKITALLRDNKDEFLAVAGAIVTMTDKVSQLITALGKFQLAENLSVFRLLSVLGATVAGGPQAGITLGRALVATDARRASLAARLPFGVSIEETLGAIRNPVTGGSSGGGLSGALGGGDGAASRAAKERAREIKDLKEKVAKASDEFMQGVVEDLTAIERAITGANLENVRREGERPRQLRSFSAATAERIRQIDLETLRLEENTQRAAIGSLQRTGRRGFGRSGAFIEEAISRGQITGAEAEQLRQASAREFADTLRQSLELMEKSKTFRDEEIEDLREQIELYDRLGTSISDSERFMRGFNSQVDSVGDAFERFGANVSNAFRNVRDLFNGLKSAVLGFFNDLLGNALQNLVRQTLGGLFGQLGGAGGGILGNLFRTPSTFPSNLAQAFAGAAGGGGITAPASITQTATGIFANGAFGRGLAGAGGSAAAATGSGFSLGGLFGGLASAGPLLGLGIGAGLGGRSTAGNILGAIGGGAVGLGASFGAAVFGAGGGLAQAALAFAGPAALIGVPLLVGSILLGRAKQRRSDEEASGQMLTQALQGIEQLAAAVGSGQITSLGEARGLFENQILGEFIQGINTLKTKSVRESRLTNQVRDLRNVFEARIPPLILEQERKAADTARFAAIDRRLIPEFATGGTTRGGLALLHPGEKVLNMQQQAAVRAMAGPNVFERAGVPGINRTGRFDIGGTQPSGGGAPFTIDSMTIIVNSPMSNREASAIVTVGMDGETGTRIVANKLKVIRRGDA